MQTKQKQPDGSYKSYYEQVDDNFLETAKDTIELLIQEGYTNEYLCKDEYEALDPSNKGAARFYQIFKVHKFHPSESILPARPIISGNSSITENLSTYINHHIKHFVNQIPAYLEDTPDFLRILDQNKKAGNPL